LWLCVIYATQCQGFHLRATDWLQAYILRHAKPCHKTRGLHCLQSGTNPNHPLDHDAKR
jgi:hypothetical protein